MLETKSGAADQRVLQLTAEAAQSPIRLVFEQIPESPSGMLRELLNVDDIFSMYFQAKLPPSHYWILVSKNRITSSKTAWTITICSTSLTSW